MIVKCIDYVVVVSVLVVSSICPNAQWVGMLVPAVWSHKNGITQLGGGAGCWGGDSRHAENNVWGE